MKENFKKQQAEEWAKDISADGKMDEKKYKLKYTGHRIIFLACIYGDC